MTGEDRRNCILSILKTAATPVSGAALSEKLKVSRQVIVQDIALLRANGYDIYSTNRGYLITENISASRVFKVIHTEDDVEEELTIYVDNGGTVEDVFVYHKAYGTIKAQMNIRSRRDIRHYMDEIRTGKSKLLSNVTSGYHYHTISAADEESLDAIQEELNKRGFLAKLQDYEPVNFWDKPTENN